MEIVAEFKENIWRQLPELFEEPGIHERQNGLGRTNGRGSVKATLWKRYTNN